MKFVIALNNEYIFEKIKERYKDKVYSFDISTKEDVIEYLSKQDDEIVLITKDNLEGNLNEKMYVKQIRLANPKVKLVYIVKELTDLYKQFLFANEVFNIIEGASISLEELVNNIEKDKSVIYKNMNKDGEEKVSEAAVDYLVDRQVITKKIISIYGTSGAGKSYISSVIAREISKIFGFKISLLDMDLQNPSLDIYNNLDQNLDALGSIIEDVDNKYEISQAIDKYMIKDRYIPNLHYMTNNASIFDIQNKFSNKYYNQIYNCMKLKFDLCFIDLPASPFLDVVPYTITSSDIIFFVVNPNYVSIRQAVKYLDLITKLWNVSKDNIKIIINKKESNSLDNIQVKSLLGDYQIVMDFNYIDNMDSYINGASYKISEKYNFDSIYYSLGIRSDKKSRNKFDILRKIVKK